MSVSSAAVVIMIRGVCQKVFDFFYFAIRGKCLRTFAFLSTLPQRHDFLFDVQTILLKTYQVIFILSRLYLGRLPILRLFPIADFVYENKSR